MHEMCLYSYQEMLGDAVGVADKHFKVLQPYRQAPAAARPAQAELGLGDCCWNFFELVWLDLRRVYLSAVL
jgi:hypothetical protein